LLAPGLLRRGETLHAVSSKALDLAAQGALGRSLALRRPVVLADCESIIPALAGEKPPAVPASARAARCLAAPTHLAMCQILK
jgi:hypothetical protein